MKIKCIFLAFILFPSFVVSDENRDLVGSDSDVKLEEQLKIGPNFDRDKYLIIYSCYGPYNCAFIFNPKKDIHIGFPDMYSVWPDEDTGVEFDINFSLNSDKICVSGVRGMDFEKIYNNKCYYLDSEKQKLIPID